MPRLHNWSQDQMTTQKRQQQGQGQPRDEQPPGGLSPQLLGSPAPLLLPLLQPLP